ncbi:hypothetical protein LTR08_001492 [Meristemomyces frigidus]|nr:hypothetical protein LTR08_001492 [Meristemomyces frigidus]
MATDLAPVSRIADLVTTFRPAKLFKAPPNTAYTSIDFDDSGEFMLCSRTDDTMQLFNTKAGAHAKELKSQKYGSALARFTHHSTSIIYASTKQDDGIRYLSMHDNSFIRYFRGHTGRVTSLSVSPGGDQFLSAAMDNTVKLWDTRSPNPQGQLDLESPYLTAYDPSASVIAVASPPAQALFLYDLKNYDKPPFASFDLLATEKIYAALFGQRPGEGWTAIEFSNNGKFILIATNGPGHYLIDAFSGELVHYLHRPNANPNTNNNNSASSPLRLAPGDPLPPASSYLQADTVLTPDGRYIIGGSGSPSVPGLLVWDAHEKASGKDKVLRPVAELPCTRSAAVVAYNPRFNLVASAEREAVLWVPDGDL